MAANLFFPESHRQMLNIIAYGYEFPLFLDLQKKIAFSPIQLYS
ncbi:hypothetical protein AsAng_0001930 [Aureispira anguillae]|uniref:Uncharacterized protein n=1 Tax=Aureispira anguillae TaxID=2864201 RepID=A0A915VK35_9BACT|nr:hypothetical protein AsAng_0001930 [Aureispira anguillae]